MQKRLDYLTANLLRKNMARYNYVCKNLLFTVCNVSHAVQNKTSRSRV